MRFENQVSLYDTDAIINKFNTQDTQLRVVQGEISAIISETEMTELISGSSTMYSRLSSVEMDVNGLTASFHSVSADVDALTGNYTSLDSRVTEISANVDGLDVSVSSLQTDVEGIETWQTQVDLKISDSAIISTVINSAGFSSAVIQEADSIRLQASNISWQSDYSSMTADGILTCTNASITGTLNSSTVNGGYVSGAYISGGTITNGNFTIYYGAIYNNPNHTVIDDGVAGILICDDGISCVGDYGECRIEADGCLTVFQEGSTLSEATYSITWPHITDGIRVYDESGTYASKLTYGALCVGMDENAALVNPVFWVDSQYLSCSGSKDRIVTTDSYGMRALVCYEMPSPMFGDIGTGRTDEGGVCFIDFNPIWSETVDLDGEYYVFLQEEGEGKLYVAEKTALGFCVKGTPNLKFSWEVKAYQFDGRGKYLVDAGTRRTILDEDESEVVA